MFRAPESSTNLCAVASPSDVCGIRVAGKHQRAHGMDVAGAIFCRWRHPVHKTSHEDDRGKQMLAWPSESYVSHTYEILRPHLKYAGELGDHK